MAGVRLSEGVSDLTNPPVPKTEVRRSGRISGLGHGIFVFTGLLVLASVA
jgi:hypothetical protein